MLENKVVNEKRAPEVMLLGMLLVIVYALTACSGEMCFGYKQINELDQNQKLVREKK